MVNAVDVYTIPQRALESYKLARVSGEAIVSSFFDYREIIMYCSFVAPNKSSFETARDTLLSVISPQSSIFQLPSAGSNRQFTCTLSDNTNFPDFGSGRAAYGGYANFEVHFNAYDPFGYDTVSTNLSLGTITASPTTYSMTLGGTWDARPVFTLTLSSFTTVNASDSIIITNPSTGLATTITRAWAASDVLIVDIKNRRITVNGVTTPWSGALPVWPVGNGQVSFSDTFSARSIVVSGAYIKRYV
jgi:hypothetical protein